MKLHRVFAITRRGFCHLYLDTQNWLHAYRLFCRHYESQPGAKIQAFYLKSLDYKKALERENLTPLCPYGFAVFPLQDVHIHVYHEAVYKSARHNSKAHN